MCEVDVPVGLDLNGVRACENKSLALEFQRLDLSIDKPQKEEPEHSPPSKRRKLDKAPHLFDRVANDFYKVFGGVQTAE